MNTLAHPFEIAAGSVIGGDHRRLGKNNQDAYAWIIQDDVAIAIVCDGCGSGAHSEVGAKLGAQILLGAIVQELQIHPDGKCLETPKGWEAIQQQVLTRFHVIQNTWLLQHSIRWIKDYALFTVVGVVITPQTTTLFSWGDGVLGVNEQIIILEPEQYNTPSYLGYDLIHSTDPPFTPVQIHHHLPTPRVQTLLLGTDGVKDLMVAASQPLPGKLESVGDLSQFWQNDRFFANPDMIRRRLSLINQESIRVDRSTGNLNRIKGWLPDDTTVLVIRRCRVPS